MPDWDDYFLDFARVAATKSKDPSTKVGAVIIDQNRILRASGYNGFPRGVQDRPERYACRELKYKLVVHAETNAIAAAARVGVPLEGCSMYVTFHPCSNCAKLLVQVGLVEVVHLAHETPERWLADMETTKQIFQEAGVRLRAVDPKPLVLDSADRRELRSLLRPWG